MAALRHRGQSGFRGAYGMGSWWAFTGPAAPVRSRWRIALGSGCVAGRVRYRLGAALSGSRRGAGSRHDTGLLAAPGKPGSARRAVRVQESPGGGGGRRSVLPLPAKICAQITREYSKSWGTRRRCTMPAAASAQATPV